MERITALYIGRVGDVIVATSFLRALRRRHPKARIRLIVGWRSIQVLPLIPFIDEWEVLQRPMKIGSHLKLARRLLGEPCDLLVDLNSSYSKTSALIARAVRAPRRLAFDKGRGSSGAFTEVIAAPAEREHMWDRYGRLAASLDAPYDQEPELRLPAADVEEAELLLDGPLPPGDGSFKITIHPGNFDRFSFRWPEEKFVALADGLLDDPRVKLFFMGGPGEREKVAAIVARLKRPAPILPVASLGVSGAMLKRMNLLVCNITGTTHLAAALGVPTFGFYAGYTQAVWRPRGARHGGTVCPEWESCRETTVEEARATLAEHVKRLSPS
ncbi:MAG: glycosyltransferase family 9 protein [Elusimicrobia bacterium]|nr:glycosyltransferase family 9 protein [Elusimicrobiota bacterium]